MLVVVVRDLHYCGGGVRRGSAAVGNLPPRLRALALVCVIPSCQVSQSGQGKRGWPAGLPFPLSLPSSLSPEPLTEIGNHHIIGPLPLCARTCSDSSVDIKNLGLVSQNGCF